MKITLVRHVAIGEYEFDEATIEEDVALAEVDTFIGSMRDKLDALMPPNNPHQQAPLAGFSGAFAAPAPAPAAQTTHLALAQAEAHPCPCGETKGRPLGSCADKDLQYIVRSYKKNDGSKEAAAIVLAARSSGLTTQKP